MGRHNKFADGLDFDEPLDEPEKVDRLGWITKVPLLPVLALVVAGGFVAYEVTTSQISLNFGSPQTANPKADATDSSSARGDEGRASRGARSTVVVTYKTTGRTADGFRGTVLLTNRGAKNVSRWQLALRIPNAKILSMSSAVMVKTGTVTIVRNPSQAALRPGASLRLAFVARGAAGKPSACKFNHITCTLR